MIGSNRISKLIFWTLFEWRGTASAAANCIGNRSGYLRDYLNTVECLQSINLLIGHFRQANPFCHFEGGQLGKIHELSAQCSIDSTKYYEGGGWSKPSIALQLSNRVNISVF